jgi:hypothetical protein
MNAEFGTQLSVDLQMWHPRYVELFFDILKTKKSPAFGRGFFGLI